MSYQEGLRGAGPPLASAPPVDTERLILRAHHVSDFEDMVALWSDPSVVRHIGGRAFPRDDVWARLLRYAGHWSLMQFGFWVVREKQTGRFVGEVGLADFKRGIDPAFDSAPEAGWVLSPSAHGKGYATEAVAAAHGWLQSRLGSVRTVCLIDNANAPSIRVAERVGYHEFRRASYKGASCILFERGEVPLNADK